MSDNRVTINLEEFLKYLLKKRIVIFGGIVFFSALFGIGAKIIGGEIVVPHSEEYLRYEKELEYHESYLEESVLMNLNPNCIYQRTLFIDNVTEKELLKDYVKSTEIWEELVTERSKTYIKELVLWNEDEITGEIRVVLQHATSEECKTWAEYLKEKIQKFDSAAEIVVGAETIIMNEKLQEEHLRWYSRIDYVKTLLLEAEAGYTLKVNMAAAVVTGAIAGGSLSVLGVLILYIVKDKSNLSMCNK